MKKNELKQVYPSAKIIKLNEIVQKMVIPPHKPNFKNNNVSKKVWDFDKWYRENNSKVK